jgi:hypothetical protein
MSVSINTLSYVKKFYIMRKIIADHNHAMVYAISLAAFRVMVKSVACCFLQ